MKKILITGADSYIGTSFEKYVKTHYPDSYIVDTVDMRNDTWREKSFSEYDSVFHVAGIAHSDGGRISAERAKQYYAVNTQLTIETAQKAKADRVRQFVFMSSAIVYGESMPIGSTALITRDTPVCPSNCYGDSKVKAEMGIRPLEDENFRVVILRPPMVYGRGSAGNYRILAKIARKVPLFPYVNNERSMLYIENLCEFVRLMVENVESGIFWPQNSCYSNTSELVKMIAAANGKKVHLIKGFGWFLKGMSHLKGPIRKAFGNMRYDMQMSTYSAQYRIFDLKESIKRTENNT